MKPNKIIVHPDLGNERRQEVIDWCTKMWGNSKDDDWIWCQKSNYDRGLESGTFDIHFREEKYFTIFRLAFGGYIVERCYDNKFVDLFEEA